ncbi:MAG: hypothetical protein IJ223_00625 [Clostridia bacterium]|nr:hypothetical protein [Clostridia bacterium]
MEKEKLNVTETGKKVKDIAETEMEMEKIKDIFYFKKFELVKGDRNHLSFAKEDVFVVEKLDEREELAKIFYEVYDKNGDLIATIDDSGKVEFSKDYLEKVEKIPELSKQIDFKNGQIDLEELDKEHSIKEELEKENEKERENNQEKNSENNEELKEDNKDEKEENELEDAKTLDEEVNIIAKNLGIDPNEIDAHTEIRDIEFYKMVPEANNFKGFVQIVHLKNNEFKVVGEDVKTGKVKELNSIETSKNPDRVTAIELGNDGQDIKREIIKAELKIKGNDEFSFSAKLEPWEPLEMKKVRRDLNTGEYFTADMYTANDRGITAYTTDEVDEMMHKKSNKNMHDEAENFREKEKEVKEGKDDEVDIKEIDDEEEEQEKTIHDGHGSRIRGPLNW